MDIWGTRYAEIGPFIRYCRDLNVETKKKELEHYEKIGAMLPVARVVYPDEYVIQKEERRRSGDVDWDETSQWPELGSLSEGLGTLGANCGDLSDTELIHCFDRELEAGHNPYIMQPDSDQFRPWSDYLVTVQEIQGQEIKRPTVEHYYSYWQVHQLYWIQQHRDLYKNAGLIELIPENDPLRRLFPRAPTIGRLVGYDGRRNSFDALSFWITVYGRERHRTFASIPKSHGIQRLDDAQASAHIAQLKQLAEMVKQRFQFTRKDLYQFLRQLIELLDDYRQKERYKLADALKGDIFAWERFLTLNTGETREDVEEELGKTNIHVKRLFRRLDVAAEERDYAAVFLGQVSRNCAKALQELGDSHWAFTDAEVNDLLNYCEREGLGLFITAMSGMVAVGDEESRRKFTRVQMYSHLKNVLNSYEYLLKIMWQGTTVIDHRDTLVPLVEKVMAHETWHSLFKAKKLHPQTGLSILSAGNTQEFLANLSTLMSDSQLNDSVEGYWARNFLVMCLARNMTVHFFPSEDSYYGDLFGPMLESAILATLYSWHLAKTHNLV